MADNERGMDLELYVGLPSLPCPRNLDLNLDLALGSLNFQRKDDLHGRAKGREALLKEEEEDRSGAHDFECNICLDTAKDPVVTPCGHLFCWPCLYQWIRTNPISPECPVCKGEVSHADLTPIYGRGGDSKIFRQDGSSDLKIPSRPHAHRIETSRQRIRRSMNGILAGEHHTTSRYAENLQFGEDLGPSLLNAYDHAAVHRLSQQNTRWRSSSSSNFAGYRLPTIIEPNRRIYPANSGTRVGADPYAASTDSLPPRLHWRSALHSMLMPMNSRRHETPTAEHTSTSSTAALITGDSTATTISGEPNRERSSRILARRRSSSNSGSLGEDEGASYLRRSRRLN